MINRMSSATERALLRVKQGQSIKSSALAEGISPSTLFRALKRIRERGFTITVSGAPGVTLRQQGNTLIIKAKEGK